MTSFMLPATNFFLTLILFFIFSAPSFSQEDLKIENIGGKKYYIHEVEPGHTLYAISKKYLVEIEDILAENPDAKEGLKVGQTLKIPVVKENKKLNKINNPELEGNFILHTVEQGQTLYFLSKLYNIELIDIVQENPGIQDGMQMGQIVKIPAAKVKDVKASEIKPAIADVWQKHIVQKGETQYSLAKKYEVNIDSLNLVNNYFPSGLREGDTINIPIEVPEAKKSSIYGFIKEKLSGDNDTLLSVRAVSGEYKIALLLPFFLDENDLISEQKKQFEKESIYPQSQISIDFYEGFLMAVDSLKKIGFNAKIFVFDTGKDSVQIKKIFLDPLLKEMDLIVGPLYLSSFNQAARFAEEHLIPIVSPFIQQNSIIEHNFFVSKLMPAQTTVLEQLASFIHKNYSGQNIIVVHNAAVVEKKLVKSFVDGIKNRGGAIKEIIYITQGMSGIQSALSSTKTNIVVIPSNDQAFVTDLVSKMNFALEGEIILFGSDSWINFDNLDINYLHKLNTHLPLASFVDYNSEKVKDFIIKFRNKYSTEPNTFAFQGYDTGIFYLMLLNRYGKALNKQNGNFTGEGLQLKFNLQRTTPGSGVENSGISIVKYEDFQLLKIK